MWKESDIDYIDIDLRNEFDNLSKQFSLKVLLVRRNMNTRCKCYSLLNHDGDSSCKICGGSGHVNIIEQVNSINQNMTTKEAIKITEIGLSAMNTMVFYFDHKVAPKVQDRIFIVGYDKYGLPVDIKKSCTVINVMPMRGDNGRLEMYKVYAKYSPEKIRQDQKRLNSIPNKIKAKIAKGVRYTWPLETLW